MEEMRYTHADIAEVMEYYNAVWQRGTWPSLNEFDPMSDDIPQDLVDRMVLIEVTRRPWKFELRYAGAFIEESAGKYLKGQEFGARLKGEERLRFDRNLINLVSKGQPSWRRGKSYPRKDAEGWELERVMLPLSESGERVDLLLSVSKFHQLG